jgi:hypothetical protein
LGDDGLEKCRELHGECEKGNGFQGEVPCVFPHTRRGKMFSTDLGLKKSMECIGTIGPDPIEGAQDPGHSLWAADLS